MQAKLYKITKKPTLPPISFRAHATKLPPTPIPPCSEWHHLPRLPIHPAEWWAYGGGAGYGHAAQGPYRSGMYDHDPPQNMGKCENRVYFGTDNVKNRAKTDAIM